MSRDESQAPARSTDDARQHARALGTTCLLPEDRPSSRAARRREIMNIDGRCHCGYVSFEANADPETTTICNCTDCQTMSGAPLRAVIITKPGTFVLFSGQPTEYRKTGDSGAVR